MSRALDAQRGHAVAIKCMLHEAYNAIGEQEADILQQVRRDDAHAQCAIVRLLGTFVEQKRFCLVLEVLGDPILQVARWGPWRQPYQERTLRSPASARRHKLHSLASSKGATAAAQATTPSSSVTYGAANAEAVVASPMPICPSIPPLPLEEIRQVSSSTLLSSAGRDYCLCATVGTHCARIALQIAVHLCGALAFLHDQVLSPRCLLLLSLACCNGQKQPNLCSTLPVVPMCMHCRTSSMPT